jgi:hypothetical protein
MSESVVTESVLNTASPAPGSVRNPMHACCSDLERHGGDRRAEWRLEGDAGADGAGSRPSGLYCSLGQSLGSRDEQGSNLDAMILLRRQQPCKSPTQTASAFAWPGARSRQRSASSSSCALVARRNCSASASLIVRPINQEVNDLLSEQGTVSVSHVEESLLLGVRW